VEKIVNGMVQLDRGAGLGTRLARLGASERTLAHADFPIDVTGLNQVKPSQNRISLCFAEDDLFRGNSKRPS
jgi:hypothetical protein